MFSIINMFKSAHFWRVWAPPHAIALIGALFVQANWAWVLCLTIAFHLCISGLGVAVGLHRYFSHKAFTTNKFWEQAMLYTGCLACHGNPLFWVALHRGIHHRFSDTDRDIHSPVTHSAWYAYQGYAFDPSIVDQVPLKAGANILSRKDWHWSFNAYHSVLWATWLSLFAVCAWFNSFEVLIALAIAQVWAIHQEALVNVVGHTMGFGAYRNFPTPDQSVNRNLLGLFTWGQALHNNHHADPASPDFAMSGESTRFEFDPSMIWINIIQTFPASK